MPNILSIITINLNNKVGLKKTIESVINQNFTDFEYIVIDGGSKDGSLETIKQYANNINYWVSEADDSIYHAMNKGIIHSSGKYLLFLNSGDTFVNEYILSSLSNKLNSESAKIFYTDIYTVNEEREKKIKKYPSQISLSFWFNTSLCHQSTYIHRQIFEELGLYDTRYRLVADWKILLEAYFRGSSFEYVPISTCNFDINGISSSWSNNQIERRKILSDNYPLMLKDWDDLHQLNQYKYSRLHKFVTNLKKLFNK